MFKKLFSKKLAVLTANAFFCTLISRQISQDPHLEHVL